MKKLLLLLSVVAMMACSSNKLSPVLSIEGGQVQGVTTDISGVYVFRGIPYAAPPIKELRWKEPQPVIPWDGVMIADKFGHPGYQSVHYPGGYTTEWGYGDEAPYSEDCLYLNVWTNAPGETTKKLPVALWIHGGGYREGWGSEPEFDGQEWANKDVILVSINYRLGVFGFLTYPELSEESANGVSGNYGILDQIAALKWIKNNISQFGGDPDNVTIFGQSAGAGSVKVLCESPLARGLFDKAVIMSGGGITVPEPEEKQPAKEYVATSMRGMFKMPTLDESEDLTKTIMDWAGLKNLEQMRAASTEMIYSIPNLYTSSTGNHVWMTQMPIIEGYVSSESFDDAVKGGNIADIPYMIGFTLNDMGDMAPGIAAFCQERENHNNKAWAYEFARPLPDDGSKQDVLKGAFHSSDLWYVFKSLKHCWRPWTDGDWQLSERMLTAWTNFAKYGDPNGEAENPQWTPCTKDNPKFMIFKLNDKNEDSSAMGMPIKDKNKDKPNKTNKEK
ncbi:MAG: carboxylesterase family protein [Bacteroidaceae bacterium]|nr:carboxylesterase family protein [Bacteroidaceae bacterium]